MICAWIASRYGKWPHEVLLNRNDDPGPFEMALTIFDIQATQFYDEAVAEAQKQAAKGR